MGGHRERPVTLQHLGANSEGKGKQNGLRGIVSEEGKLKENYIEP